MDGLVALLEYIAVNVDWIGCNRHQANTLRTGYLFNDCPA